MNIPIAGTLPSHEINSFSNSTVFRPDLYIPTQCQVIRSSATWSAGIGEVDGKSKAISLVDLGEIDLDDLGFQGLPTRVATPAGQGPFGFDKGRYLVAKSRIKSSASPCVTELYR